MSARHVYDGERLKPLIAPCSIAVVGASDRPGSLGARAMANLRGFTGQVWPVSSRLQAIEGVRCYPKLADLPGAPDCVVLAVPAAALEQCLIECAQVDARSAVVFASGYAELGSGKAVAAQRRLAQIASEADMRLVGPNTTGIANLKTGAHCGFAEFPHAFRRSKGAIAIVAQSGAMSLALSQAAERGVSVSHVLSSGNSADVDVADYVNALASDPDVGAIALAFEGLADPQRLGEAMAAATAGGKPVTALKIGRSPAGAAAARRHSGFDAGQAAEWDEFFSRLGIAPATDLSNLVETAIFLAKTRDKRRPRETPRVAILSSSGGMGILAADAAHAIGVATPQPDEEAARKLRDLIPAFGSPANPCDMTAQATSSPRLVAECADVLLADDGFDALVLPWGKAWRSPAFDELNAGALRRRKPICLVWMSQWLEGPGAKETELLEDVAVFRSVNSCMTAIRAWAGGLAQFPT